MPQARVIPAPRSQTRTRSRPAVDHLAELHVGARREGGVGLQQRPHHLQGHGRRVRDKHYRMGVAHGNAGGLEAGPGEARLRGHLQGQAQHRPPGGLAGAGALREGDRPPGPGGAAPCPSPPGRPGPAPAASTPAPVCTARGPGPASPRSSSQRTKQRRPLPHISASLPSGLYIRIRSAAPGAAGVRATSSPSAPTPKWRSQTRAASGAAQARPRPSPARDRRPSTTTKSFPAPWYLTKGMAALHRRPLATIAEHRLGGHPAGVQPVDAPVRAEPAQLAPGVVARRLLVAGDGLFPPVLPAQVGRHFAVPETAHRGALRIVPPVDQRPHLLHQPGLHLLQDAGVDAGVEPGAGQLQPHEEGPEGGRAAHLPGREGDPGGALHLQGPDHPAHVARLDARGALRIDPLQLPLQHLPPLPRGARLHLRAGRPRPGARRGSAGRRTRRARTAPCPPPGGAPAPGGGCARSRQAPGAGTAPPSTARPGRPRPAGGGARGPARLRPRLGRPHVHPAVDHPRVGGDDLRPQRARPARGRGPSSPWPWRPPGPAPAPCPFHASGEAPPRPASRFDAPPPAPPRPASAPPPRSATAPTAPAAVLRVSRENTLFQHLQTLQRNRNKRHRAGEFVVEGVRAINQALAHRWTVKALVYGAGRPLSGVGQGRPGRGPRCHQGGDAPRPPAAPERQGGDVRAAGGAGHPPGQHRPPPPAGAAPGGASRAGPPDQVGGPGDPGSPGGPAGPCWWPSSTARCTPATWGR